MTEERRKEINEYLCKNTLPNIILDNSLKFLTSEERNSVRVIWEDMDNISTFEAFFIWFLRENKIKTI